MSTKIYNLLKFIVFCITVGAVIYLLNADHENTIYKGVKEGFEAGYTYGVEDCKGSGGFLPKGDNRDETIANGTSEAVRKRPSTDNT